MEFKTKHKEFIHYSIAVCSFAVAALVTFLCLYMITEGEISGSAQIGIGQFLTTGLTLHGFSSLSRGFVQTEVREELQKKGSLQ